MKRDELLIDRVLTFTRVLFKFYIFHQFKITFLYKSRKLMFEFKNYFYSHMFTIENPFFITFTKEGCLFFTEFLLT